MANRRNKNQEVREQEDVEVSGTPEFAEANADAAKRDELEAAVANNEVVVSDEESSGNGDTDVELGGDESADGELSVTEASVLNRGRAARGEEVSAEGVAADDPHAGPGASPRPETYTDEEREIFLSGDVGEDTMAVRQSTVDRVIDGKIVRASADGTPDRGRGTTLEG